jgi:hypothetical protein
MIKKDSETWRMATVLLKPLLLGRQPLLAKPQRDARAPARERRQPWSRCRGYVQCRLVPLATHGTVATSAVVAAAAAMRTESQVEPALKLPAR